MIELEHRVNEPDELTDFNSTHPESTVADFDSPAFNRIKSVLKVALNQDQGGLCVYCERKLEPADGQIEHIKPKAGKNAYPELCFAYANFAHSCINNQTCGQKKKDGLLPIEPGIGCNQNWFLSRDGSIEALASLTRKQRHPVVQTRDMLGLNKDSSLVRDREAWFKQTLLIAQQFPDDIDEFLQVSPFRAILATTL